MVIGGAGARVSPTRKSSKYGPSRGIGWRAVNGAASVDDAVGGFFELVAEALLVQGREIGEPAQRAAAVDGEALARGPRRLGSDEIANRTGDVLGLAVAVEWLLLHVRRDGRLVGEHGDGGVGAGQPGPHRIDADLMPAQLFGCAAHQHLEARLRRA